MQTKNYYYTCVCGHRRPIPRAEMLEWRNCPYCQKRGPVLYGEQDKPYAIVDGMRLDLAPVTQSADPDACTFEFKLEPTIDSSLWSSPKPKPRLDPFVSDLLNRFKPEEPKPVSPASASLQGVQLREHARIFFNKTLGPQIDVSSLLLPWTVVASEDLTLALPGRVVEGILTLSADWIVKTDSGKR